MASDEVAERAYKSKSDDDYLAGFIEQNKQFILRVASKTVNRFITESDDEYSIGLMAFYEAVRAYSSEKGQFPQFAALVIKRRLLDYLSTEARHSGEIPVEPYSMDGEIDEESESKSIQMELLESGSLGKYRAEDIPGSLTVRDEIDVMQQILKGYGFSFYDLIDASPKAEKTRQCAAQVISFLVSSEDLMDFLHRNKALPIKELCGETKVKRKIIERHRKYIIAAAEILSGDFPMLCEYLRFVKKEVMKK